jgi:asparagine N-glycosylation enzyme membrane subunit Stt3
VGKIIAAFTVMVILVVIGLLWFRTDIFNPEIPVQYVYLFILFIAIASGVVAALFTFLLRYGMKNRNGGVPQQ